MATMSCAAYALGSPEEKGQTTGIIIHDKGQANGAMVPTNDVRQITGGKLLDKPTFGEKFKMHGSSRP
jgi:hypothetical protein